MIIRSPPKSTSVYWRDERQDAAVLHLAAACTNSMTAVFVPWCSCRCCGCWRRSRAAGPCRRGWTSRDACRPCPGRCPSGVHSTRPLASTVASRSWLWLNEIWWMPVPSAFITCSTKAGSLRVLVLRRELRLALIEQDRLRLALAGRGEHDAAVRQVVRARRRSPSPDPIGARVDDRMQGVGRDVIFIDAPRRAVLLLSCFCFKRPAHGEHHLLAVERDVDVLHVVSVSVPVMRAVMLRLGARSGRRCRACTGPPWGRPAGSASADRVAQHAQVVRGSAESCRFT